MNISYINTLEAALFSTNCLSLIFEAVLSSRIAKSPPDLNPELINDTIFEIFSDPILLAIASKDSSMLLPVVTSFPTLAISPSSGANSLLALRSIALSTVIPALKFPATNCKKSGKELSIFSTLEANLKILLK